MMENGQKRRSGIAIMARLIGLVKPLLPVMVLAITLGVLGYLSAIFLTILAGCGILSGLNGAGAAIGSGDAAVNGFLRGAVALGHGRLFALLILLAVLRGLLHYGEQYCNHYIAFRLLAIIRHKVFAKLRALCPARLEGRDRGNLVAMLTSDIELLEVFYAHTISPIAIAFFVSLILTVVIGKQYLPAGILALVAYLTVGVILPLLIGGRGGDAGLRFRNAFGELNSYVLESLRGLDESIRYGNGRKRLQEISDRSKSLGGLQKGLSKLEEAQRSVTNAVVLLFSFGMLFLMLHAVRSGQCSFGEMLIAVIAMMGSFGPVIALSNLANNLNQTLASGERILRLLEEEPEVAEVTAGVRPAFTGAAAENVDFRYEEIPILKDVSLTVEPGQITGIHGPSGSGKSTLLKLLMRFFDVNSGAIRISGEDIRSIETEGLRDLEGYVTQETTIFHASIADNIAIGRPGASREEIEEAAKKASLGEFLESLPAGLDTMAGELGDTLSGGERQRIGIARAFLHDAPFLLLDETTSNLDSLNEGMILRSLDQVREDRTVLIVSHRQSTLGTCDRVIEMAGGRFS